MHHPLLLGNSTTTTSTTSNDELYPHHGHYDDHSPFLLQDHDGVVLSYLLSQQQQHFLTIDVVSNNSSQSVAASNQGLLMEKEEEKIQKQSNRQKKKAAAGPRKRVSGKKDRHSKICTAHGPRDRRMRLPVQIARKFFDLQDMLGFDKASKTIDWLFTKSRSAIKELKQRLLLPSSSLSTTVDESTNEAAVSTTTSHTTQLAHSVRDPNKNNMRIRMCRAIGKGSRDEARARARERTRQKLRVRPSSSCCLQLEEANPKDHHHHHHYLGKQELAAEKHNCYNAVMMKNNNNRGRPSFEDADGHGRHGGDEFPGFTSGNWSSNSNTHHRNVIKSFPHFTGNNNNNVLQVENPKQQQQEPATTSLVSLSSSNSQLDGDQHNYSSAAGTSDFMTTTSIPLMPKPNTQPAELAVLNPSCSPIHFMPNPNSRFLTSLMISKDPHSGQFLKFN